MLDTFVVYNSKELHVNFVDRKEREENSFSVFRQKEGHSPQKRKRRCCLSAILLLLFQSVMLQHDVNYAFSIYVFLYISLAEYPVLPVDSLAEDIFLKGLLINYVILS